MNIIISDLDEPIISFMDLPELVNLMQTNKNYYEKIKRLPLIHEWKNLKKNYRKFDAYTIFVYACLNGYMHYSKSLLNRYDKINIHDQNEYAFTQCCIRGHIIMAKWLINLGENHGYGKINLHGIDERIFRISCERGHFEVAKWLIDLGENHGYKRINIHAANDSGFFYTFLNEHYDIVKWLIDLGENHGYGKINQEFVNYFNNRNKKLKIEMI